MTELALALSDEQMAAVQAAVTLLEGDGGKLSIGGYAGTGKTTIVRSILARIAGNNRTINEENKRSRLIIAVVAFTGKAVSVLRRKGVFEAQTLHSLMYEPVEDENKNITWKKRPVLYDESERPITGVIVDEASMLNTTLLDDLMSYGLPVVFIGDHGQLEPIGDNPGVMADPDIRLETIHRQARGSAVLWFAHAVREGKQVNWASVPPDKGLRQMHRQQAEAIATQFDVILCGFNGTRHRLNKKVRELLGRADGPPLVRGERLICLKNSRSKGVFNGMMFFVEQVVEEVDLTTTEGKVLHCYVLEMTDDNGRLRRHHVYLVKPTEDASKVVARYWRSDEDDYPTDIVVCDYGYALTVHKAQGSEWNKVLVIEEIWHEKWTATRWRYTAATRAAKDLTWVSR